MRRKTIRLWIGVAAAAATAASALAVATYAQAGDFSDEVTHDFDCDDKRDGVDADEGANVGGVDAGAVTVQYSKTGEKVTISQATGGIAGNPEHEDGFGHTVAVYDETGDGCDDLIIGAPDEDIVDKNGENRGSAGMVWIIPGSQSGLDPESSRGIHLDSPGIPGAVADGDSFGRDIVADSGTEESMIVVGAPGTNDDAGAAYFLRGELAYRVTQDSPSVSGAAEPLDRFGESLAITDRYFAIGAPGETINGQARAGMAHVFGLELVSDSPKQRGAFHQDSAGITGKAEEDDQFGGSLSVVAYRPTPESTVRPLVSAGSPYEEVGAGDANGMGHLVTLPAAGEYKQVASVHEDVAGVPGETQGSDVFGNDTVLAVTDASPVGTPSTTRWVFSAQQWDAEDEQDKPEVFVFGVSGVPGDDATLISAGDFGLPGRPSLTLSAGPGYLHSGRPGGIVVGLPWGNILNGENEPIVVYKVDE